VEEALADGTFAKAKTGGALVGKTRCGKGTKIRVLTDAQGTPLSVEIPSASPAEVTLMESLLDHRRLHRRPRRLISDRAADSDPLRQRLARRGIDLICPHRKNRPDHRCKTVASGAASAADGKSNAPTVGCKTFDGWSSAMNSTPACSGDLFNSLACSLHCVGFETPSRVTSTADALCIYA